MEELNKKIAEWLGYTNIRFGKDYMLMTMGWNKKVSEIKPFTTSLDAFFEYVVPKLTQAQYYKVLSSIFYYEDVKGKEALALCRAVEKLTDDE